jgi:hypothetical protein
VIELLRRMLGALLGAPPQQPEPELPPAERLDAAHQKLKETIPPPED